MKVLPVMLCVVKNEMVHCACHRLLQGVSASVVYGVTPDGTVTPSHQLQVTHLRQVACILHCREMNRSRYVRTYVHPLTMLCVSHCM